MLKFALRKDILLGFLHHSQPLRTTVRLNYCTLLCLFVYNLVNIVRNSIHLQKFIKVFKCNLNAMSILTGYVVIIKHSVTLTCSVFTIAPDKVSNFITNN